MKKGKIMNNIASIGLKTGLAAATLLAAKVGVDSVKSFDVATKNIAKIRTVNPELGSAVDHFVSRRKGLSNAQAEELTSTINTKVKLDLPGAWNSLDSARFCDNTPLEGLVSQVKYIFK